jgi:hypothetical protein
MAFFEKYALKCQEKIFVGIVNGTGSATFCSSGRIRIQYSEENGIRIRTY